jgi:hypothetical protein
MNDEASHRAHFKLISCGGSAYNPRPSQELEDPMNQLRTFSRRVVGLASVCLSFMFIARVAHADEIWVAPTYQTDLGGVGIASSGIWPASAFGAARLAWAIPNNLLAFESAKVALIPHAPGGAATLHVIICAAANADAVTTSCSGPIAHAFTGVSNQLLEIDITAVVGPKVGVSGRTYLTVLAYSTPTTTTDHIVGLRFSYEPAIPAGVATLGANTFTSTQTAPAFVGDGSGLTNLPLPIGVATLGANTFVGTQTAPAFVGNGSGLSNLPFPVGAARLVGGNAFTGTQSIAAGNLTLDNSTATTGVLLKGGVRFLHNFGIESTFLGLGAGNTAMTGGYNTAAGVLALVSNATGNFNTAVGTYALKDNTDGWYNTATGYGALIANRTGLGNTAYGDETLFSNVTTHNNTAVGAFALHENGGGENTATGASALQNNTTGENNTANGYFALFNNATGSNNTAVGTRAGLNSTTGSSNIYLGAGVVGVAGESNTMYLGQQGTQTKTFIAGVRGITTLTANAIPVVIDSAGQLGTISSSRRFKEDIYDMPSSLADRLLQLRPVTFRYTAPFADGSKPIQYGLVAEEVAEVFPELAVRNARGEIETVHYETLNVLLLKQYQEQQAALVRQQKDNQRQQHAIEQLREQVAALLASHKAGPQ